MKKKKQRKRTEEKKTKKKQKTEKKFPLANQNDYVNNIKPLAVFNGVTITSLPGIECLWDSMVSIQKRDTVKRKERKEKKNSVKKGNNRKPLAVFNGVTIT